MDDNNIIKREVEVVVSPQARMLLKNMPEVSIEELVEWYIAKKISIGGADVIHYLETKND